MFWKLWKYELKCSYRNYLLMYAILLLASLFMNADNSIITVLAGVLFAAMIILIMVMTIVLIVRTYNQSMFSRAGYLTHTLPVSGRKLMLVKILNASIWFILSYLIIMLSAFILTIRVGGMSISELLDSFGKALSMMDFDTWMILLTMSISLIESVTMIYMIMNFTHTNYVQRHRGLIAIVIYVVLNIIISMINGLILTGNAQFGFDVLFNTTAITNTQASVNYMSSYYPTLIENAILLILFYIGASYLLENKIEIE